MVRSLSYMNRRRKLGSPSTRSSPAACALVPTSACSPATKRMKVLQRRAVDASSSQFTPSRLRLQATAFIPSLIESSIWLNEWKCGVAQISCMDGADYRRPSGEGLKLCYTAPRAVIYRPPPSGWFTSLRHTCTCQLPTYQERRPTSSSPHSPQSASPCPPRLAKAVCQLRQT